MQISKGSCLSPRSRSLKVKYSKAIRGRYTANASREKIFLRVSFSCKLFPNNLARSSLSLSRM